MEEDLGHRAPLNAVAFLAAFLGFVQFGLFFADRAPGPALPLLAAGLLGAGSGLLLGRLRPGAWLALSALAAWGALVMGAVLGILRVAGWVPVLIVPAGLAILGGRIGAVWARRRSSISGGAPITGSPSGPSS
jgi:hypothetical protein